MNEFEIIEVIATKLGARRGAREGVGDDGAILDVPPGKQLVISTDTLVEEVHFEPGTAPGDLGYKSLAVNLSDLAAMGAEPTWFFLALTLPDMVAEWVEEFADGMSDLVNSSGVRLCGGDVTSGPLNVTITACGLIADGTGLTRSGARTGDIIAVSGPTGLAGFALSELGTGRTPPQSCLRALRRPGPRLEFGRGLIGLATSCIDVSDGLLADLGHIATASGVGMQVQLECLPLSRELAGMEPERRWDLQLGGGDDYELCFTAPPHHWNEICELAGDLDLQPSMIGKVVSGHDCTVIREDGMAYLPSRAGYVHGAGT